MITVAFAALGAVVASFALYHLLLAVASFGWHALPPRRPTSRLTVLVPAHDEEALIRCCIESLVDQTYPRALYEIVVIADNCTDRTAELARDAGAAVLVRDDPEAPGKGQALRWAMDRLLARPNRADAVVIVDADSRADREFLERLARPFEDGAQAVQGESLLVDDGTPQAALRAAAFLLINRVRPAGRAVLGLPSHLAGNGMLFASALLAAHPWSAFSSTEDLEYGISLRLAGVPVAFARGAVLRSPAAPTAAAAAQQQLRWEGGKAHVARRYVPRLLGAAVRTRKASLLEAAFELASPPLGLLAAAAVAGTGAWVALAATDVVRAWSLAPWVASDLAIPLYVLVGLRAADAPAAAYRALAHAPILVARKLGGAHRLLTFRADTWVRTERAPNGGDAS